MKKRYRPVPDERPFSGAWTGRAWTLFGRLIPAPDREVVLGDVEELFRERVVSGGRAKAVFWFWRDLIRSIPHFFFLRMSRKLEGGFAMVPLGGLRPERVALLSLALLLPTIPLLVHVVLFYATGPEGPAEIFSPFMWPAPILLGIAGSVLLNLLSVLRLEWRRGEGDLVMEVRIRGRFANLMILGLSIGILAAITIYGFVENFAPVAR